jgi:hypothetical protein
MENAKNNFRFKDIYFYVLLVLYFVFLIVVGYKQYVWTDEGFSLMTSSKSVSFAFNKALEVEFQPPLFYVLLNLWRSINSSYFFARMLSIILLFISVFPLKALLKEHFGERYKFFTLVFLTNSFIIASALEIRYQSLMILLTILAEYFFLTGYYRENRKFTHRLIYIVIAIFGVYTQYYFSFLLIANFIVLVAFRKYKISFKYIFDMIWPVIGLALLLPYFNSQVDSQSSLCNPTYSLMYYPNFIIQSILKMLVFFPKVINEYFQILVWATAVGLIFVLPLLLVKGKVYSKELFKNQYLFKVIILMLLFTGMLTLIKYDMLPIRHLIVVFIPFWILCFSIVNLIKSDKLVIFLSITLILISLSISIFKNAPLQKGKEFKDVLTYVSDNEKAGENIVVYRNIVKLNLQPGYKGPNTIYAIPREIDYTEAPDYERDAIKNYYQLDSVFQNIPSKIIWLVSTDNSSFKKSYCVDYHDEILEEFVDKNFTVISSKQIEGIWVRKLIRIGQK